MPTRFTASRRKNPGTQAQASANPAPARQGRKSGARRLLSHVHFQNSARNQAPSGAAPYGYGAPAQQTGGGGGGVPDQANNEDSWFERAKQKMSEMHCNEGDTGEGAQDDQDNDGDNGDDNGEESWFEKAKGMLTGDNNDGDDGQAAEGDQGDDNGEGSWHDWLTGDDNGEEGGLLDWLSNEITGQGDEEQQQ